MPDLFRRSKPQSSVFYLDYPNLSQNLQLVHGTFTRHGGVSRAPYDTLNTSYEVGDRVHNVSENLITIQQTLGMHRFFFVRQTHGTDILLIDQHTTPPPSALQCADAMITNIPETGLMIKQADCQAVILFDPRERVIANVHCGWRGNVNNILGRVVRTMASRFGCNPKNLMAAIAPSLGPCCAEFIGHEEIFPSDFNEFRISENHFDLWRLSSHQLVGAGIDPHNIMVSGICTRCRTDDFFSYRGEGVTGRFATVVMLK